MGFSFHVLGRKKIGEFVGIIVVFCYSRILLALYSIVAGVFLRLEREKSLGLVWVWNMGWIG